MGIRPIRERATRIELVTAWWAVVVPCPPPDSVGQSGVTTTSAIRAMVTGSALIAELQRRLRRTP